MNVEKLISRRDLTSSEAESDMKAMMSGEASPAEMAAYLVALKMKVESPQEISSFAKVMREYAARIEPRVDGILVDMCGTGGDHSGTFNISTAAMFVVAAAGIPVAKHGNRGFTSKSGSADVLEALGVRIDLSLERIKSCIEDVGVGFMFAPNHHPAMKNVMPVRKELRMRTVFNLLGPLTNPAGAKAQLMGVYDPVLTETVAEAFRLIGHDRAMVVHGDPGLDELSTAGATRISELRNGEVRTYTLDASTLGFRKATIGDLRGGTSKENAATIRAILLGEKGPCRDIVVLNAAAGIVVGGRADDMKEALRLAYHSLDSGGAFAKLEELARYTALR